MLRAFAVAFVAALTVASLPSTPASAWESLPNGLTSCWQAPITDLGDRTCYDVSDQTIYIINANGSVYASMGATGGSGGMGNGSIAYPWEWSLTSSTATYIGAGARSTTATLPATSARIRVSSATSHDLLEWFASGNTHEFVTVP